MVLTDESYISSYVLVRRKRDSAASLIFVSTPSPGLRNDLVIYTPGYVVRLVPYLYKVATSSKFSLSVRVELSLVVSDLVGLDLSGLGKGELDSSSS